MRKRGGTEQMNMSRPPGREGEVDEQMGRSGSRNWEKTPPSAREGGTEREQKEMETGLGLGWELARTRLLILHIRKLRPGRQKWFVQGWILERIICFLSPPLLR